MPFELGIDYGSRQHGHEYLRCKKCLILEKKLHDFRRALSDLGGVDIKNHDDEPIKVVRAVRDWFVETVGQLSADSPVIIWWKYTDFSKYLFDTKIEEGLAETDAWEDIQGMPVPEYINRVNLWLSRPSDANRPASQTPDLEPPDITTSTNRSYTPETFARWPFKPASLL